MTARTNHLIALGRWIVVATHVLICVLLLLCVLTEMYTVATGNARLQMDEPWESIFFYAFFTSWIAVVLCWGVFCLVFAVLMRRRVQAGSLRQIAALACISIPFWGVGYYDYAIQSLTDSGNARSG